MRCGNMKVNMAKIFIFSEGSLLFLERVHILIYSYRDVCKVRGLRRLVFAQRVYWGQLLIY